MANTAEGKTDELVSYLDYEAKGYVKTKYEIHDDTIYIWPEFLIGALDDRSYIRAEILDLFHMVKREYCKQYIDQKPTQISGSFTEALKNKKSQLDVKWCQFEDPEDCEQRDVKVISIESQEI